MSKDAGVGFADVCGIMDTCIDAWASTSSTRVSTICRSDGRFCPRTRDRRGILVHEIQYDDDEEVTWCRDGFVSRPLLPCDVLSIDCQNLPRRWRKVTLQSVFERGSWAGGWR